jgi:hypothetical protein
VLGHRLLQPCFQAAEALVDLLGMFAVGSDHGRAHVAAANDLQLK